MRLHSLPTLHEPFHKQLRALSKLAYDGLVSEKMVFSIDDLEAAFPECSDIDIEHSLLSLMTVFKGFKSTGEELSYQFLHLTIQEFLAASWAASQLSAGKLLMFFQDNLTEKRYRMMLLFLAGISKFSFPSAEIIFCHSKLNLRYRPEDQKTINLFFFLAHLIYESQNFSLFHTLASTIVGAELTAAWYSIAPFDCLVLAHFLVRCGCSLKLLSLNGCGLTSESLEIMHRVNLEHCGTTQIEEVNLNNNPNMITKLALLPKLPMFQHTVTLVARNKSMSGQVSYDLVDLHRLLKMRHLINLDIEVGENMYLSLHKFQVQSGNIDNQNAVDIFKSLEHNTSLKELDLSGNSQLAESDSEVVGCAIERMLNLNRTLKVLNLRDCGITNEVAAYLANGLAQNYSVTKVVLHSNKIGSCGTVSIFRSLEHNTSLEELDLSENSQLAEGDSEAVGCAIERILNVNRTLKGLDLSGCNTTDSIVKHILNGLNKNASIVTLHVGLCESSRCAVCLLQQGITHPTLTTVGVTVVGVGLVEMNRGTLCCNACKMISVNCVEFFRALNNSSVKVLKMNVQDLTDQTAEYFAVGLAESQSVQALNPKDDISSAGVVSIFRSLEHNNSLEELDLKWISQLAVAGSEAVGVAIERMLNVNRTLKVLNLCDCRLGTTVATHIAAGLAQNASLAELHFGRYSGIASEGWVRLFKVLCNNTSMKKLHISSSNVKIGVSVALAEMLSCNKSLSELSLWWCHIPEAGLRQIAKGLLQNTSLQIVWIGNTQQKTFLETEIMRLKSSGPQISKKLEIK